MLGFSSAAEESARENGAPRFDIAVRDVSARDFFLGLSEDSPYDIILNPKVGGSISLTLRRATIPEILETTRAVYGYGYRPTPTGFVILPSEIRSEIFEVNYLHAKRSGHSETRVSAGQLTDQGSGDGARSSDYGPTTTGGGGQRGVIESSSVVTESDADLWQELGSAIESIVGGGEGRSVVLSPQAGIVVVRAMPTELREVGEYLTRAESNLERQVILETKILEIRLDDGYQTGVNWSTLIEMGAKSILLSQTGGGTVIGTGASEIAGNAGVLDPGAPALPSTSDTSTFGGVFAGAFDLGDFTAVVELLETQGDVHVLSSPRISTLNNQKAVIKVGSDEFFVTDVSTTTVTGTATTTSPDVTLTPFFSGIALDVLPQIAPNGEVLLHVHPSVSRVQDQVKEISVGLAEPLNLPLALSTIRETDTFVRAQNGQIVVIGGLMEERASYDRASIPLLGRIPFIGKHLFGQQLAQSEISELIILMRPIVVENGAFGRRVEQSGNALPDPHRERWRSWIDSDGWDR